MQTKSHVVTKGETLSWVLPIAIFVGLMALASRVVIPLPFSPVPVTLQVLIVILSGLILGSKRGTASMVVYLGLILTGLPLTAFGLAGPAAFISPTAGYLIAFVPAAYLIGLYSEKFKGNIHFFIAGIIGIAVIYLGGTAWLAIYLKSLNLAWSKGVVPFILVDIFKAIIAVIIAKGAKSLWKST